MSYTAPIGDMRFALEAAADLWAAKQAGLFSELDPDLLTAILDGAADFAEDTLAPLNRAGDRAGVTLKDGVVTSAPGFKEAYKQFAAGGWQGLAGDSIYSGAGLPTAVAVCAYEMMHAANMSFGLAPMLTLGAIEAIEQHGAPDQKELYLEKLSHHRPEDFHHLG